jgi:hypothetical protein
VIDGYGRALNVSGLDSQSDRDVNRFTAEVLDLAAAKTGAAVVLADHTKKDNVTDFGSAYKRNNLTGTDYFIQRSGSSLIAPGSVGWSEIRLTAKDRPGWATEKQADKGRSMDDVFVYVEVDAMNSWPDGSPKTEVTLTLDAPAQLGLVRGTGILADVNRLREVLKVEFDAGRPPSFPSVAAIRKALKGIGRDMTDSRVKTAARWMSSPDNAEATMLAGARGAVGLSATQKLIDTWTVKP